MNNIFVSWKQKIESRIISDLKSQYTESEEQIRQRKEQFLKKQSFFGFFDYKSSLFAR